MTSQRQGWIEFLRSPDHGGQYLYARGEAKYSATAKETEKALSTFLQRLDKTGTDMRLLLALHFLSGAKAQEFVLVHAKDLAKAATHSSTSADTSCHGAIRGKVIWHRTLRQQQIARRDPSYFDVRVPRRTSDVPENRLLKWFLVELIKATNSSLTIVGSGNLSRELDDLAVRAQTVLKEPYIRDLPIARIVTSVMRQRARRNRDWRYHILADLQEELEATLHWGRWQAVISLLQRGWLEPLKDDDLFELYLLVLTLEVIEKDLKIEFDVKQGLIRAGRGAVAEFSSKHSPLRIAVYFDQGPSNFLKTRSEYIEVSQGYGLTPAERRPDIAVLVKSSSASGLLFIEAKKTSDDQYERDSVYKALGYLRDFNAIWKDTPAQKPKIVIVYPELAPPREGYSEGTQDLILLSGSERARLEETLTRVIDQVTASTSH